MATAAQITSQLRVAVAAAKVERGVRQGVLDSASTTAARATARADLSLIEGVLSSLQTAFQRASGMEL